MSDLSSLMEDSNESYVSHASAAVSRQNMECENQRLRQINTQLENAIDSLKKQLKDAIDSSTFVKASSESVHVLKQQLTDANDKRDKLLQQVKDLKNSNKEKESRLLALQKQYDTEKQAFLNTIEEQELQT